MHLRHVVALAGGVGGAKLAEGLQQIVGAALTVVGNVGDDEEFYGLHVSPDLDTVTYWLAGVNDGERGWGLQEESWRTFETLEAIGAAPWFRLGDRDLATHLLRTRLLRQGGTLTEATAAVRQGWKAAATLLPVTNDRMRTVIETDRGPMAFQEYFVRHRWQPTVRAIHFDGADAARVTPEVRAAIEGAETIVLCPSNPFLSIDPILAIPPLRALLQQSTAPVVAVSPIVGGEALKGPAAKLFRERGEVPTPVAVARRYRDLLDGFLLDRRDAAQMPAVEALGLRVAAADTIMSDGPSRRRVAAAVLALAGP